jgi:NADH:quinone reductase (non-electrogenic)
MERRGQIVIIGGGFAGVWAALGAAALLQRHSAQSRASIVLVSPDDAMVIRPRLYEAELSGVRVPLAGLLSLLGVEHRRASVEDVDVERRTLTLAGHCPGELTYDQLLLCAGSELERPLGVTGVFSVDSYEQALALHGAIASLSERPTARFNAVVVGAGFTGLEVAAELADMLAAAAHGAGAPSASTRVLLVDQAMRVAPDFGPDARPTIVAALRSLGVETRTGARAQHIDTGGVTLRDGARLDADLTVWAGGPRASRLNEQLGVRLDPLGRVGVDATMATPVANVWAAGDCASVTADGNHMALMSCQHAMPQGRQAGENAAATLLGYPRGQYRQPLYLTCLDLGSAGALLTCGFDRNTVLATGEDAKRFKRYINRSLIYPPANATRSELLELGQRATPGPAAAAATQMALRSAALRNALTAGAVDRAAQYASAENSWRPRTNR